MKAKEITMQIVKNLGNYEAVRLEATWLLDEDEELKQAFKKGRTALEEAYIHSYSKKEILTPNHKRFESVCKALYEQRTNLKEIEDTFIVSEEAKQYLFKHGLI